MTRKTARESLMLWNLNHVLKATVRVPETLASHS